MKRKGNGFTLMEMLIVVTIIGILSAIIIPRLFTSTTSAKRSAREAERQTINSQIELFYFIEGKYPDGTSADSTSGDYSTATWTDCAVESGATCTNKYWPEAVPTVDPLNCVWQWDTTTRRIPEGNNISDATGNGC
tara:strand:+ start:143 stop:550 length:408 start_codon:yes stop_codon:yes gene_type:complete